MRLHKTKLQHLRTAIIDNKAETTLNKAILEEDREEKSMPALSFSQNAV